MSAAEIITEIDAYLLCLRQAHELLDGPDGVARRHNVARKQAPIEIMKTASAISITAPSRKVQAHQKVARPKTNRGIKAVSLVVAFGRRMAVQMTPIQPEATAELPIVGEDACFLLDRSAHRTSGVGTTIGKRKPKSRRAQSL
jgi:hypothetical protein